MAISTSANAIKLIHDSLIHLADDKSYDSENYGRRQFTGQFEYSYEMLTFLRDYSNGYINPDPAANAVYKRCLDISLRIGCYPEPLTTPFGYLTDSGTQAVSEANYILGVISAYNRNAGFTMANWQPTKMDEIIPFGVLPAYSIRILRFLWELVPQAEKEHDLADMAPVSWENETVAFDGYMWATMRGIRNNQYSRVAVEKLIKFGLIELRSLPKTVASRGKGRAPMGFRLSPVGMTFSRAKLEMFHPAQVRDRELRNELESVPMPQMPQVPEMPKTGTHTLHTPPKADIVDGEDLRDLFGS